MPLPRWRVPQPATWQTWQLAWGGLAANQVRLYLVASAGGAKPQQRAILAALASGAPLPEEAALWSVGVASGAWLVARPSAGGGGGAGGRALTCAPLEFVAQDVGGAPMCVAMVPLSEHLAAPYFLAPEHHADLLAFICRAAVGHAAGAAGDWHRQVWQDAAGHGRAAAPAGGRGSQAGGCARASSLYLHLSPGRASRGRRSAARGGPARLCGRGGRGAGAPAGRGRAEPPHARSGCAGARAVGARARAVGAAGRAGRAAGGLPARSSQPVYRRRSSSPWPRAAARRTLWPRAAAC